MHPITAESLAVSGFPGKKKRTKHQHIVSMFGPIMVRVVGVEPTRITSQEPKGDVTLVKGLKLLDSWSFQMRCLTYTGE